MMAVWHYEPACDLDQTISQRLRRFPREPDILCYAIRSVAACIIRLWLRTYHGLRIEGRENLPAEGSFVLVCNHASHMDALCLLSALPLRRLHQAFPAAAADYFFVSLPRLAISVLVVNALPFHRNLHVRQSLSLCRELLANPGNILIVFPEGTRSGNGAVGSFKPGIATLLAGSTIPVVPCYLSGAALALPKGCWLPRPVPLRLTIGKPRVYSAHGREKESIADICSDLREAVLQLSKGKDEPSNRRLVCAADAEQ
jgi:1-acyl-sn-glycerol-3-phosphate acyltransferase